MTDDVELWHLSKSYFSWSPYCDRSHRKGIDFQTFSTEETTCPGCREVARENWKPAYFEAQKWGVVS